MKRDTRQRILFEGAKLVHLKGFGSTGIQEVLKAAGVPKGSFYFYFENKEDFGLQLIDYFGDVVYGKWKEFDEVEGLSPMQGLKGFFGWFLSLNERNEYKGGCPFGNLGQELGDINDRFRMKLELVFAEFKTRIKQILIRAQELGEISRDLDANQLSDLIYSSFQGALIQMKVSRSSESMENFNDLFFNLVKAYSRQENSHQGG